MERFLNALGGRAAALDRTRGQPRFALVASLDPARHTARVLVQPEGVLSGWLPVLAPWAGAGWGVFCLPAIGEQVLVLPQEGDGAHGVVVGGLYSAAAAPPAGAAGELVLRHRTGAALRLANDGTVRVQGDLWVEGRIHAEDFLDGHGGLTGLRAHYNAHIHPGEVTVPPTPQD